MEEGSNSKKLLTISLLLLLLGSGLIIAGLRSSNPSNPPNLSLPAFISPSPSALGISGEKVLVTKVIDGDTIELDSGQKVRYIGIDTPETVDPRRFIGCFGKEASQENKKLIEGKEVYLVKDVSETDKFGRLLRYVYLIQEDNSTLFINDYLVRQGFAKVSTFPPDVKFTPQFLQAEKEARENRRGLWQKCR